MKKLQILLLCLSTTVLCGCYSMSEMQTGRVLKKNEFRGVGGIGFTMAEMETAEAITSVNPLLLNAVIRGGLGHKLEVSLNMAVVGSYSAGIKRQFIGTDSSKVAGSIALAGGYSSMLNWDYGIGYYDISIPLYFSFHPSEAFAFYINPRYQYKILSEETYENGANSANWVGGATGIMIGKKTRFILEGSLYVNDHNNLPYYQLTTGIGFKIGSK